jgi:hypothetical protein
MEFHTSDNEILVENEETVSDARRMAQGGMPRTHGV